ncbi:PPE family protein [Mycobacterium noviomagense]|uniref:PPE family protein n=1 Tax=Mycobacterium noviomagense TaxID=459858 RepID=A0A7I7P9T3_9MYCO|nr:PPE family protein [Mycobacterium noviomagense]ORB11156.1 PPE family protein [Mycobacterium noviomagense]BBY05346.1 PPE family protein PPE43 [Mycobacterium noviomagense]
MFDFGALPPEINSARIYAGPGSGPMMAAAAAWNNLAAELGSTAAAYQAVIAELTSEWMGPSSAAMAAAVQPYVAWMSSTAAAAERAAAQATASAAAYQTAFAMTVPPPLIAANRAQLAALVATNILGQNTPAIMATEAHYMQMWAQDAAAMYGYAASSASAGTLNPLTDPAPIATPGAMMGQAAAVGQTAATATGTQAGLPQLVSTLPSAVQSFASPLAAPAAPPGLLGTINDFFGIPVVSNSINSANNVVAWNVMNIIPNMILLQNALGNANAPAAAAGAMSAEAPLAGGLASPVLAGTSAPAGAGGFGGAPVMAGMGQASAVGKLSVPGTWSAATPQVSSASALEGSGWAVAAEETPPVATMPAGMPSVASAGRAGAGFGAPRYGFKPTVMPKTVLV